MTEEQRRREEDAREKLRYVFDQARIALSDTTVQLYEFKEALTTN